MRAILFAAVAALALGGCERATRTDQAEGRAAEAGGQTIAEALAGSPDGTRFLAAVKSAGLEPTLAGPVPYTVLVPSDAAFDKLPAGTLATLMKPEARPRLIAVITQHVLPGTILTSDMGKAIERGGGKTMLATMGRSTLTATRDGDTIVVTDPAGGKARLTAADEQRKNGVVHRIDSVLTPG